MSEEKVRVRLVFEDQRILSKEQKKQGLKRCWVVLDPKCQRTVSEFSEHIFYTFCLFEACPYGLSLSMEGFVLPPFESSCVLKDKDIVCVKKKKKPLLKLVGEDSEDNVYAAMEVEERARHRPGQILLGNEEFQEETEGYSSESEEEEVAEEKGEEFVLEKNTSKKRKASSKSISSKRKKCKLATTEESPVEPENVVVVSKSNGVKKRKPLDVQKNENDKRKDANAKSMVISERSSQQEESKKPNETKKTPSRSARRKKAKRQWLREKTKIEKEELQQNELIVAPSQKPAISIDYQVTKENHPEALENQQPGEHGDGVGDEVVPVEVRPGHIRFKPLGIRLRKFYLPSLSSFENFMWNGNMTKKKGQKWGTEKTGFSKRYDQAFNEDSYLDHAAEVETPATGHIDYEKLAAYTGLVKKGDVIAYRLIELTSSWTPEVSSFRVGKISYYDPDSKKVTLIPVQEYPIQKKVEEDDEDFSIQSNASLYNEDGSLEIEFSALLDVRCIKTSSSGSTEAAKLAPPKPDQTATKPKPSTDNSVQSPAKENGKVNPWEELSEALSAKKAELSQANNGWNKKESSSGGGSWSYKALRGSAMGPVMNYLRSQKEI
ncbi:unnamed protein product [Cochlearia groenlandica]